MWYEIYCEETRRERYTIVIVFADDYRYYPIFYKDNKLRYLGCNVEFERFWGISLDSILNKQQKEIFDSKTIVSKADRTDKLVLKNKSAITYEDTLF